MVALTRPCITCKFCPYSDFLRHMYPSPKFNKDTCVLDDEFCCPVIVWGDDDPTITVDDGVICVRWKEDSEPVGIETILQDIEDAKKSDIDNRKCSDKLSKDFSDFIKTDEGNKVKEQAWKEMKEK